MDLKGSLKNVPRLGQLYRLLMGYLHDFPNRGKYGFHGDRVFQRLIQEIISCLPITSFVETGTYIGDSTAYVASRWSNLSIFTCEINEDFFLKSKHRLKKFKNVELSRTSSEGYLKELVENNRLGKLPLFFLDAHWYDYWPLEDEIYVISFSCPNAIVIIDDFQVPGRPEFGYAIGGGGSKEFSGKTVSDQRVCGLDLVKPKMNQNNTYHALFPCYTKQDAFPRERTGSFQGYIVIFQNLKDKFESLKKKDFISRNYKEFKISFQG